MNIIRALKKKLKPLVAHITGRRVKGNGEFSKRIKHRHATFWNAADAEQVRNTIMQATDPIEQWQDVVNWQRKFSNKYNSREFAKLHDCRVAKLYWKGRDINQLTFAELPDQYVIRPTIGHSCGLVFLMNKSVNLLDKQNYTESLIKAKLTEALAKNPRVEFLIEEFLQTENGEYKIPIDYKFYFFNGHLATIQVINRVTITTGNTYFYDEHWQALPNVNTNFPRGAYQDPPLCLAEMIAQAKKLSEAYQIFVRVDFYATNQGAVFGEFTPTPAVGDYFTSYGDRLLVDYWNKYCPQMI